MLREWPAFDALAKSFAEGEVRLRVAGLTGAARALVVAELLQTHPRPALVVVGTMADAHRWTQDLRLFGAPVFEFPQPEPRLWRGGQHREADAERATIARRLAVAEPITVVATPLALDARLWSPTEFASRTLRLSTGVGCNCLIKSRTSSARLASAASRPRSCPSSDPAREWRRRA